MKKELVVHLSEKEILRVLQILIDQDKEEALAFLKEYFEEKIEERLKPPCGPETAQALKAKLKAEPKNSSK